MAVYCLGAACLALLVQNPLLGRAPRRARAVRMGDENMFGEMITIRPGERAYMVGVDIKENRYKTLDSGWDIDDSLDELARLCDTAGLEVCGREYQNMQH